MIKEQESGLPTVEISFAAADFTTAASGKRPQEPERQQWGVTGIADLGYASQPTGRKPASSL
jgi:hypothetical protein